MTHSPRVLFDTDIETVPHGVIMSAIRGHLIADASGQVSDRLALRHFAHVDDVSQRTVSV